MVHIKPRKKLNFFLNDYNNTGEYGSNVYFITDGRYIKIGKANNVENRLMVLQTGSPLPLKIQRVFKCKDPKEAYELEHFFHVLLKNHRLHGEWFDI